MTAPASNALRDLRRLLDGVHAPTERAFLDYGEVLSSAAAALRRVGGDFEALTARLSDDGTAGAAGRLDHALRQVMALAARQGGNAPLLAELGGKADVVAAQVGLLRKTVAEVAVLAMNAKIQASHVTQAGIDFTVFTVEIARLGNLALATIDQTAARLAQLRQSIQAARNEGAGFERRNAAGLADVHARLHDGLATMSARRLDAARSAAEAASRSEVVAQRIAAAIGEMQINDIAAQRIAHVATALGVLADVLDDKAGTAAGEHPWLAQLPPGRRQVLAGAVLRLQSAQLARTRDEFGERVGELARHMAALAHDAREVATLVARTVADGPDHGASFVVVLERDMAGARDQLRQGEEARAVVGRLTETMVADFSSMASDLASIQSIDADMRVMGLNATLKCGRLGGQGRALGVIAQELRNCSKRTEDSARRLSKALAEAMALARSLTAGGEEQKDDGLGQAACAAMDASLQALDALGSGLEQVFSRLRDEVEGVAGRLAGTAGAMDVGGRVAAVLDRAIAEIDRLAAAVDPAASDPRDVRREVERLLSGHYTMDSERMVHDLFADGGDRPCMPAPAPRIAATVDDVDSCFL